MSFLNDDSKYELFLANIENENKFSTDLNNIYKVILKDSFKNILNIPKIDFLNKLSKDVNSILVEQYSNKISENQKLENMINEITDKYEKKYDKYYEDLSSQWNKYFHKKTNIKKNENKENILSSFYFKNFIKHCAKTGEYALHICDKNRKKGKFIIVYGKKKENDNIKLKFIICEKCRKAYFIKTFKNYCDYCNIKYYSTVLNANNNNNNNLFYATIYPSHCNILFNRIITCPKCYKKLYINIKENKLVCLNENCNYFNENPDRIEWECNKCEIYYIARVIIYNEIELIHFDEMIKKALILKKLAHPKKTCCINKDNISSVQFYHNKKCHGILYFFEENKKLFLVCDKCKAINYFTKFIWTCPFCGLYYREINSEQNELKLILSDKRRGNRIEQISRNKNNLFDYIKDKKYYKSIEFFNTNNSKESKNSKKEIKKNKFSMSNLLLNSNTFNRVNSIEKFYNLKLKNISTDFSTSFLETYNENNMKRGASQTKRSGLCRKIMHDLIRPLDEKTYNSVDKRILKYNMSNLNILNKQNHQNNLNNNMNISNKNSSSSYEKRIIQYNNRPINNLKINIKLIGTNNNLNDKQWFYSNNNQINKLKTDIDLSAFQTISSCSKYGIKTESTNNINNNNSSNNNSNLNSNRNIYIPNEENIYNRRNNKNKNNVTNLIYKNKKILPIKEGNNYMVYKKNFILKDKDKPKIEKGKYEEKKIHNIHDKNKYLYRRYLRNKNDHVYYSDNNGFFNNISTNKLKDIYNSVEQIKPKKMDYSISTKVELSSIETNNKRGNRNNEDIFIDKYTQKNMNNVYNMTSNNLTSYKKKKYNALIINRKDKKKEENNKTVENNKKIENNNKINNNNKKELERIKSYRELDKQKTNMNNNIIRKGNERNQNKINHVKKSIKEIKGINNNKSNGRLKKYFLINDSNNSNNISKEKKNNEQSKNKNQSKSRSKGKEEKNNKLENKIPSDDDDDDFIEATISSAIKIEDEKIKMDKKLYDTIKMRLISIVSRSNLPLFDVDNYLIWKKIGDGSNGEIFEISNTNTDKKYALKKLNTDNLSSLESMINEFQIIYQNKHKYILKTYGICVRCIHNNSYALYVLMDLALTDWEEEIVERQKLRKYYTEKELIIILKQLVSALVYLQKEKSVSHRDIKCENILIFKNFVYKLCDFGEAKQKVERNIRKTLRGTDFYMSPLLYNGLINHENYVKHNPYKSDVFSLGFCLIISAALNFGIIDEIRLLNTEEKIREVLVNYFNKRYSDDFIYLMMKMIAIDEKDRPDFIELNRIIQNYYSFDIN